MLRTRLLAVVAICSSAALAADPPKPPAAKRPTLLDVVDEKFREQVGQVIKSPTMATKGTEDEFVAHPKVYDWLLEHPDRTATAWQRIKVPCVDITDLGKGQFFWTDEKGSELAWQPVGRFENGLVWYATGKMKAGAILPTIPVRAVAVLHAPRELDKLTGAATFKPIVHVYLLSDSRVATAALKVLGSDAAKMAEQGADQLLFFFSGVARYLHKKPDQIEAVLGAKKQ